MPDPVLAGLWRWQRPGPSVVGLVARWGYGQASVRRCWQREALPCGGTVRARGVRMVPGCCGGRRPALVCQIRCVGWLRHPSRWWFGPCGVDGSTSVRTVFLWPLVSPSAVRLAAKLLLLSALGAWGCR